MRISLLPSFRAFYNVFTDAVRVALVEVESFIFSFIEFWTRFIPVMTFTAIPVLTENTGAITGNSALRLRRLTIL